MTVTEQLSSLKGRKKSNQSSSYGRNDYYNDENEDNNNKWEY